LAGLFYEWAILWESYFDGAVLSWAILTVRRSSLIERAREALRTKEEINKSKKGSSRNFVDRKQFLGNICPPCRISGSASVYDMVLL